MESTVPALILKSEITFPIKFVDKEIKQLKYEHDIDSLQMGNIGLEINGYTLKLKLYFGIGTEIWLAANRQQQTCIVKLSKHYVSSEIREILLSLESNSLVPIFDYGKTDLFTYEVMPYYRNGHIQGPVDETSIREIILPSLIEAIKLLHSKNLVHNDIKPENIFWNDECNGVLLGDYGCVTMSGDKPKGYSLSYAAPELLFENVATSSGDYVSLGLTLGNLLNGKKNYDFQTLGIAQRTWEKGLTFSGGSGKFNQLIIGLIQRNPSKRYDSDTLTAWVKNQSIGTENRVRHKKNITQKKITLVFDNPFFIVEDIEGMLLAAEYYWDHFIFLLEQSRVDLFLRSIKEEYYTYCLNLKRKYTSEQTAFLLTFYFSNYRFFVWQGKKYVDLKELENTWTNNPESVKEFLLNGSVRMVLEKIGADQNAVSYVKELENIGRLDIEKACNLLFIALRGEEHYTLNNVVFYSPVELIEYLFMNPDNIEETVHELLTDTHFHAWMTFQGYGDFVESILRRCR